MPSRDKDDFPEDEFDDSSDDQFDDDAFDGAEFEDDEEDEGDEDDSGEDDADDDLFEGLDDPDELDPFSPDFDSPRGRPSEKRIRERNRAMQRRQEQFQFAAQHIACDLVALPFVQKVVLIGSVASPLKKEIPRSREYRRYHIEVLHECGDLDLAVWVSDVSNLKAIQKIRSKSLNELLRERNIGIAHHQVEIFLLEPETNRYLGRLCTYAQCPKNPRKRECLVAGCGAEKFLQLHEDFHFYPWALDPNRSEVLFQRHSTSQPPPPGKPYFVHVDIDDAGRSFADLLKHIESGGKAVITRNGQPVVRLLPVELPEEPSPRPPAEPPKDA